MEMEGLLDDIFESLLENLVLKCNIERYFYQN